MLIVLPNERTGLPGLLERLTSSAENFAYFMDAKHFHKADVIVELPVFSIEGETMPLAGALSNLGLGSIFGGSTANLSGMTGGRDVFISGISHKALIDVSTHSLAFI